MYLLSYNGRNVGVRVKSILGIMDLDMENAKVILNDFGNIDISNIQVPVLPLREINGLLCYQEDDKIKEGVYKDFARVVENRFLLKDFSKTDVKLKSLYNYYNDLFFGGSLPLAIPVFWNSRMTGAAGKCVVRRNGTGAIMLSPHYHEKFPEELESTLVHEMIHLLYPGDSHGVFFQNAMNQINKLQPDLNITIHSQQVAKVNYVYECVDCGARWERAKRMKCEKYTCKCGGKIVEVEDYTQEYTGY